MICVGFSLSTPLVVYAIARMEFLSWCRALVAGICNLITERGGVTTSPFSHPVEAVEFAQETYSRGNILGSITSSEGLPSSQPTHEIFLSHSGHQKAFVEQLYQDYKNEDQYPFFDVKSHSLPKGEKFPPRIFKAARECKVAVIVLTEQFLKSRWPMMELITFVDAQKTSNPGLKLYPVLFNRLSFEDLQEDRWKEEWMKMIGQSSQRRHSSNMLTLEKCAEALQKLRQVAGDNKKYDGSEVDLRRAIIKETIKLLPTKSDIDMKDIQGADRLCEVLSGMFQYSAEYSNKVQYLGLYGMGGLGKTTMCKALCSHFSSEFDSKVCHVELGGHEPEKARRQLDRQKKVLQKLTALKKHAADNIQEPSAAKERLKERLIDIRVFLAVDNVQDDEASRQEARDYLECISYPGSKVLITSRSQDIVNAVLHDKTRCKPIPYMNATEAMELFLKTAALQLGVSSFNLEETQILRECLKCCCFPFEEGVADDNLGEPVEKRGKLPNSTSKDNTGGHYHPLALRAVARFLQDVPKIKWREKLHDPSLMLHHSRESKDIFSILGLGFDSLCDTGKQLFFDIALHTPPFLDAGKIFEWLVVIHGRSDHLIDTKLRELRRKSFLSYQDTGQIISMHDLYKEFAKRYLANNQHKEFGIYLEDPSVIETTIWSAVPRVSLLNCKVYLPEVQPWSSVVMVHLVQCKCIHNFSIGQLYNLRHLMILDCSQLEVLSWTQNTVDKGGDQPVSDCPRRVWGMELRFIELLYNRSLKSLPDFSQCLKLQTILVKDCCSLVEPLTFRSCSNLEKLRFLGENTPHVEVIQACPKLTTAQLAWRTSYGRMPELRDLPLLTELVLNGPPSALERRSFHSLPLGKIQEDFLQQYPEEMDDLDLPGIGLLLNLKKLDLKYMPLGKLPAKLKTLQILNLKGCLLSQLVDFSALSYLQDLTIAWTNVKEVRGIGCLLELESFDCSYCFRLKKIPDLHRLRKLKFLSVLCCNRLRAVPRLPLEYHGGQERNCRLMHGALSSQKVLAMRSIPTKGAFVDDTSKASNLANSSHSTVKYSALQLAEVHPRIQCDGCNQRPLIGPRFKAKSIQIVLDICRLCFTRTCDRGEACQESGRITIRNMHETLNYDLCLNCFEKSGCNREDFFCIDKTLSETEDASLTTKPRGSRLDLMQKYASLETSGSGHWSSSLQKLILDMI